MTNLDSILKTRDITLLTKFCLVKVMVFPVVMYSCESWTTKKAERWRIDAFKWWCWRKLLRVSWTARRLNQSVLKEIHTEYSLEGVMLKLKLQYFGHLMWRADSLENTLMLGTTEGRRKRWWWSMRWLDSITHSMDMSSSKLQEIVKEMTRCSQCCCNLPTEQQQPTTQSYMIQNMVYVICTTIMTTVLAFSVHQSQIKKYRDSLEKIENWLWSLAGGVEEHCRLMPQELCPLPWRVYGFN